LLSLTNHSLLSAALDQSVERDLVHLEEGLVFSAE
jgi:hypothetical protein